MRYIRKTVNAVYQLDMKVTSLLAYLVTLSGTLYYVIISVRL